MRLGKTQCRWVCVCVCVRALRNYSQLRSVHLYLFSLHGLLVLLILVHINIRSSMPSSHLFLNSLTSPSLSLFSEFDWDKIRAEKSWTLLKIVSRFSASHPVTMEYQMAISSLCQIQILTQNFNCCFVNKGSWFEYVSEDVNLAAMQQSKVVPCCSVGCDYLITAFMEQEEIVENIHSWQ